MGNARIVVDTDMTVPKFVDRLRIDLYTEEDHRWYVSRDVPAFKSTDWPVSFTVFLEEGQPSKSVIVRLRAYKQGKVRPFDGERFYDRTTALPGSLAVPMTTAAEPKALEGASTPATEPEPLLAIDRLVRVRLVPDVGGVISVVLRGACVGTMADLAGARTCIDKELALEALADSSFDADMEKPSVQGTFEARAQQSCTAPLRSARAALFEDEVCVPGGVFLFGSADYRAGIPIFDDVPERIAIVPAFRLDEYEVTVGRFRQALADGFSGGAPMANDGPLAGPLTSGNPTDRYDFRLCTWTTAPGAREQFPLNCIDQATARAFCQWSGGDLPREVQWEYAATAANRDHKTHFPWGDLPVEPACGDVTYQRDNLLVKSCGFGPVPVAPRVRSDADPFPDLALGIDVVDLSGSLSELMADSAAPLASQCWLSQRLVLPSCGAKLPVFMTRGGAWPDSAVDLVPSNRQAYNAGAVTTVTGFRCARPGDGP